MFEIAPEKRPPDLKQQQITDVFPDPRTVLGFGHVNFITLRVGGVDYERSVRRRGGLPCHSRARTPARSLWIEMTRRAPYVREV